MRAGGARLRVAGNVQDRGGRLVRVWRGDGQAEQGFHLVPGNPQRQLCLGLQVTRAAGARTLPGNTPVRSVCLSRRIGDKCHHNLCLNPK